MRNLIVIFLSVLLAIILSYSCGKPCRKEVIERCEVHPLYLKYFGMYQLGNYWIFESEVDGTKDSLFVEVESSDLNKLNEITCERYSIFSKVCTIKNINNFFRLFESAFTHQNSCYKGEIVFYYNPYDNDKISIYLNNNVLTSKNAEILPEILIDSTSYNQVLHIYINEKEYFFDNEIGLIRYKIKNSDNILSTYNLKSYFIQ